MGLLDPSRIVDEPVSRTLTEYSAESRRTIPRHSYKANLRPGLSPQQFGEAVVVNLTCLGLKIRVACMNETGIVRLKNAVDERDHAFGSQTAPVTLLEYGNFECIHCGRAYPVIKEIQRLLGDDLRFAFRHFPTVRTHPHAIRAAEAAESAAAQGNFWKMHDELFTHQQALEDHDLSRYAKRIGLDVERFTRDMAENSFLKKIEAEYQSALFDEHVMALRRSTLMRYAIRVRPMSIACC